MQLLRVAIVLLTLAATVRAATSDSLVRIVQLSPRELLLVTTAERVALREDLSSPASQIRFELLGIRPADSVREVPLKLGSTFSVVYVRYRPAGCLVLIECSQQIGHVVVELPYSHAVYVRAVDWNDPAENVLALGMVAWMNRQYTRAVEFWRSSLAQGKQEASFWLGIAESLRNNYRSVVDYLSPLVDGRVSVIPDAYAALSLATNALQQSDRASLYRERFVRETGRSRIEQPQIGFDDNRTTDSAPSLLDFFGQQTRAETSTPQPTQSATPTPSDTDVFAQLRRLQRRSDSTSSTTDVTHSSGTGFSVLMLGSGGALLLIGLFFLRGYFRWRKQQFAQMAAAMASEHSSPPATPQNVFEELMKIASDVSAESISKTDQPAAPTGESTSDTPTLFDFDEETYRTTRQRAQKHDEIPTLDDRLFYQADTEYQLSHQSPSEVASDLSEQERDLLRILEQLSRERNTDETS